MALGYSLAAGQGGWRANPEQVAECGRGWSLTRHRLAGPGVNPSCLPECCVALGQRSASQPSSWARVSCRSREETICGWSNPALESCRPHSSRPTGPPEAPAPSCHLRSHRELTEDAAPPQPGPTSKMGVIIPNAVNAVSTVSAILVILLLCCYCPCNLSGTEFWEAIEIKMDGALDSGSL